MNKPFVDNFAVHSYDTDMNAVLSLQNVVKYYMETAIDHTCSAGYGIDRLVKVNRGWVVLNWVIKMNDYPKLKNNIKISTWAHHGSTLQAERFFKMEDESGHLFSEAASRWAFLDLEKRHPVRFSHEMDEAYCCDIEPPFDPGNYGLPRENEQNLVSEKILAVRRSETDTNGHANNVRYVEWALDEVPDDIYINYAAEEIRVLYRKECTYGDKGTVKTYIIEDNGKKLIISLINDEAGKNLCKISVFFCKKS
ncbi:hypothetical protein SDC9_88636 [bioreactor metagenome]|uniref:Acyl-ACP thioesterase n=1 Tax=bioreactor metagenome TaxID=1076179 RepID=A0A644ZWM5_9ZZZZ